MKKVNKKIISIIILIIVIICLSVFYKIKVSNTKIGFINYQVTTLGTIAKSNNSKSIDLKVVYVEDLKAIKKCDLLLINGMGLKITEDQRGYIKNQMDRGVKVFTSMATNPANNLCNLEIEDKQAVQDYIYGGGITNYTNLLLYIRKKIDKKVYHAPEPQPATEGIYDVLYHPGIKDDKEQYFNTVEEYEKFLSDNNLLIKEAKKIVITGQMADATGLINTLEKKNYVVYPILSFAKNLPFIKKISPDAIINMAHGRMGDAVVRYLQENNILLFCPLSINDLVINWENDPLGMSGGFLSQSVVMPEIDGGICTYAVFSQYNDNDGFRFSFAVPERTEKFVEIINNYFKLKEKSNIDKKITIVYYKGPGQSALSAAGMEVIPSLYNLLSKLKIEGYNVSELPSTLKEFEDLIMQRGKIFGTYAEGAFADHVNKEKPEIISKDDYLYWVKNAMRDESYRSVVNRYGEFPGSYLNVDDSHLALSKLQFGNVVLMPQLPAAMGDNEFKIVHGVDAPPPHPYIASYLWARYGFKTDVLIHFGTHGSLEFTPKKQVALCSKDWSDILVGSTPHLYLYTIGNVGEGIIAKRRSYAVLQSYLTAPFIETSLRDKYTNLYDAIDEYNNALSEYYANLEKDTSKLQINKNKIEKMSLNVKNVTMSLGFHRDLDLDSVIDKPYSEYEILKIENFAEELASEKITGNLYVLGQKYSYNDINTSVYAMTVDPIAFSIAKLDKLFGKVTLKELEHKSFFNKKYSQPASKLVKSILNGQKVNVYEYLLSLGNVSEDDIEKSHNIIDRLNAPKGMMAMMQGLNQDDTTTYSKDEVDLAIAVNEIGNAISNVNTYRKLLSESPDIELNNLLNTLNGGYTSPSPGGDPIINPNTLPTGRNLYSINAEETPTEKAWEKGVQLAKETIELYRKRNKGEYPKKISYTLWSGEFIETGGATIAQVLYMLGVEPIRDRFGRVSDLKLIPSNELGRPRIDVVVQTSGQLRDLAASRLFLINRAVEMAANADDKDYDNLVKEGVVCTEAALTKKGLSPKEARLLSTYRVFGAANGGYGTGIQSMVEAGDRWDDKSQIAEVYMNNMGAFYGNEDNWEEYKQFAFEAALTNTDVVIQPRQSNTWGPISLDHIYEFMGGLNLAVRQVTGKEPDAYFSDYRNRNYNRIQEVKESIGVEARTTILNPKYISEKMKGGASSADVFSETITNVYGWEVMKPNAIEEQLWNDIYDVYVEDKYNLKLHEFFENTNPAALQELTAVMLETARKGMWKATDKQISNLSKLHTDMVIKYNAACTGFVCNNMKLKNFVSGNVPSNVAQQYDKSISKARQSNITNDNEGVVMKKETLNNVNKKKTTVNTILISVLVLSSIIILIIVIRKRQLKNKF